MSVNILLQETTIKGMAALLEPKLEPLEKVGHPSVIVMLREGVVPVGKREKSPLFIVHPVGGHVYFFRDFAAAIDPTQTVYGIQSQGVEGDLPLLTTIEEMAALYLQEIQKIQPQGPYHIGGASFGGMVAYEMAQLLHAQHEEVALLFMIDTPGGDCELPKPEYDSEMMINSLMQHNIDLPMERFRRMAPDELWNLMVQHGMIKKDDEKSKETIRQHKLSLTNSDSMYDYIAKPYAGKIIFFRAIEPMAGVAIDPAKGWQSLAIGGLEIHDITGNHLTMAEKPHVKTITDILKPLII